MRCIVSKVFEPDSELIAAVSRRAEALPGLALVVVFGSVARGRALPTSDVDVGVLGGAFWDQLDVASVVGAHLEREADPVDLGSPSPVLAYEVASSGVVLFARDNILWPSFRARAIVGYLDFLPTYQLCADGARRRLLREAGRG